MTVVAWDGTTLAADKRSRSGGLITTVTKVRRIGDLRCAGSGDVPSILAMFEWIANGRIPEQLPASQRDKDDWAAMIVIENGKILDYQRGHIPQVIEDRIYAIGSGRDFALAAMHCGKTAAEAVEIASHFDSGCGNGVDVLRPFEYGGRVADGTTYLVGEAR